MKPSADHVNLTSDARASVEEKTIGLESGEKVMKSVKSKVNARGIDLGLNYETLGSDIMVDENNGPKLVESSLNGNVQSGFDRGKVSEGGACGNSVGEFSGIKLVVDLSMCLGKSVDNNGSEMNAEFGTNGANLANVESTEKEGQYKALDLVWGKVKGHPWWPGLIFDPWASTSSASKHYKKDGFLVAYFGTQTFAWNEVSNIKPFRLYFSPLEKQSDGRTFSHAVDCALDEVSRRVEFGLACGCLPDEVYSKIRFQVVPNAGIRKECSRIDGGDEFSTVASFKPVKVMQCVLDLAKDPLGGISRLEVLTVGAQKKAFNRWKGYRHLLPYEILGGSENEVEDDCGLSSVRMTGNAIPAHLSERAASEEGRLNSVSRKRKLSFDGEWSSGKKMRCLSDLMSNGSMSVPNEETKTRKSGRKRKAAGSSRSRMGSQENASQTFGSPSAAYPSADEILSLIRLAAVNPLEEQHGLNLLVTLTSDFRNYHLEKNAQLGEDKDVPEETGVEKTEENAHQPEAAEVDGFEGVKDSYWTDRIIQVNPDDSVFNKPNSLMIDASPKTSKDNPGTALILKFANLESVPSAANLNAIFSRYGTLIGTETDVFRKNNCAKLVFERRSDAETAFSSAGKFSLFGPSLISYCLDYAPTPRKTPRHGRKQNKKGPEAMQFGN